MAGAVSKYPASKHPANSTDVSNQIVFQDSVLRKYIRIIIRTRNGSRSNEPCIKHCKAIVSEWDGSWVKMARVVFGLVGDGDIDDCA